jgi:TRAP-type C4-dicarboxylate transport system substrate-binding protein
MGRVVFRFLVVLALAASVPLAALAPVNIRLATLAPENSPWTTALRRMGAAWAKATENRVRLTVYAGTIPSESSAIARMAVGGLQAATLMVAGLSEIDEAFNVFAVPFFFESDDELAHVQQKLTPLLSQRLEARKFRLVNWGNGGWVQLFSKHAIRSLDDLKRAKLYTTEGSPKMVQWYTSNGFHPVPLATGEIPKQLKLPTGAIDAAPSPPVFALALQFFRDAPHMLDVRVAPLVGATIMTEAAWTRIAPEDQAKLLDAARAMEREINAAAPGLDAKSIAEMKAAGLQVVGLDAKAAADFKAAAEKITATLRGGMIPADVFDLALRERDAYRKTKAGR